MFRNRKGDCFICSVANLLNIKYRDYDTAKYFYKNAVSHPAVFDNLSMSPYVMPLVLRDVTEGKYSGKLYVNQDILWSELEVLERIKIHGIDEDFEKWKTVADIAANSLEESLVLELDGFCGKKPYVVGYLIGDNCGHAVVDFGFCIVDNGRIKKKKISRVDYIFDISAK